MLQENRLKWYGRYMKTRMTGLKSMNYGRYKTWKQAKKIWRQKNC